MSIRVSAIVACDKNRVIGKGGRLPWHLPEDLKRFSRLTKPHAVLMGRKTFESLPDAYRPLPERFNLVLSRKKDLSLPEGVVQLENLEEFFNEVRNGKFILPTDELWIIGGEEIYRETLKFCDFVYLTKVDLEVEGGDAFLPDFESEFVEVERETIEGSNFIIYQRQAS